MEELTVNHTYGTALFEAAQDLGKTDEILKELTEIDALLVREPLFHELVRTPSLTAEAKKEAVRQVFEGRITPELVNFLYVLIDKRRIGQFAGIVREFRRQVDDRMGVSAGTIYSVAPLSQDRLARFEEETSKLLQKQIRLENLTDPALIGGVTIYIDGKLIDASIRRRLDDLRESLM